jgi:hypothetical protein
VVFLKFIHAFAGIVHQTGPLNVQLNLRYNLTFDIKDPDIMDKFCLCKNVNFC